MSKVINPTLLASAGTVEGIQKMINKFWCSDKYRVNPETLSIEHPEWPVKDCYLVTLKRGRYRFEVID